MQTTLKNKTIFCRDNLEVMRGINSNSIDLIYLDPPFNKKKVFSAPIGSSAEGASFSDIFRKEDIKNEWVYVLREANAPLADYLDGIEKIGYNYNKYYLIYMAIRMIEIHRILKPTGSVYLHCDPTMSHYLKIMADGIFGEENFCNEIVWCYSNSGRAKTHFAIKHDIIFFYSKSKNYFWNDYRIPLSEEYISSHYNQIDENGKRCRIRIDHGKRRVYYPEEGMTCNDWWDDLPSLNSVAKERLGYPTQKPLALLERIILASSNEGDIVLDPFCGCATTCVAADRLKRQWVGIDISEKAYELVQMRLAKEVEEEGTIFNKKEVIFRTDIPMRTDTVKNPLSKREIKTELYGKQKGFCNGCKVHFQYPNLALDHVMPSSKGGGDGIENIQLLCGSCNSIKGDRTMEYLMTQLSKR